MNDPKDEGFAQRWSRLKQEAREGASPSQEAKTSAPPQVADQAGAPPAGEQEKQQEKPFDPADLPSVDSLKGDSDYSLFMRREVPEDLRQKALRRLWATDPVLSAPDAFDMHTLDYNAVPTFPDGVKTLYRIGQGMLDEAEAEAEKKAAEEAACKAATDTDSPDESAAAEKSGAAAGDEESLGAASQHPQDAQNDDSDRNKS